MCIVKFVQYTCYYVCQICSLAIKWPLLSYFVEQLKGRYVCIQFILYLGVLLRPFVALWSHSTPACLSLAAKEKNKQFRKLKVPQNLLQWLLTPLSSLVVCLYIYHAFVDLILSSILSCWNLKVFLAVLLIPLSSLLVCLYMAAMEWAKEKAQPPPMLPWSTTTTTNNNNKINGNSNNNNNNNILPPWSGQRRKPSHRQCFPDLLLLLLIQQQQQQLQQQQQ